MSTRHSQGLFGKATLSQKDNADGFFSWIIDRVADTIRVPDGITKRSHEKMGYSPASRRATLAPTRLIVSLAALLVVAAPAAGLRGPCCCGVEKAAGVAPTSCCTTESSCGCCAQNAASEELGAASGGVRVDSPCRSCSCDDCPANNAPLPLVASVEHENQGKIVVLGSELPQAIDLPSIHSDGLSVLAEWRVRRAATLEPPLRVLLCVWVI